jgi:hypothetical protein
MGLCRGVSCPRARRSSAERYRSVRPPRCGRMPIMLLFRSARSDKPPVCTFCSFRPRKLERSTNANPKEATPPLSSCLSLRATIFQATPPTKESLARPTPLGTAQSIAVPRAALVTRTSIPTLVCVRAAAIDVTRLTCIVTPGTSLIAIATSPTITPIVTGGGTVAVPGSVTVTVRRGGSDRSSAVRAGRQTGAHHTGTVAVAVRTSPVLSTRNSRNAQGVNGRPTRAWALSIDSETPRCSDQPKESSAVHAKVAVAITIFPRLRGSSSRHSRLPAAEGRSAERT